MILIPFRLSNALNLVRPPIVWCVVFGVLWSLGLDPATAARIAVGASIPAAVLSVVLLWIATHDLDRLAVALKAHGAVVRESDR